MNLREKVIFGLSDEERDTYEQGIREQDKAEVLKKLKEDYDEWDEDISREFAGMMDTFDVSRWIAKQVIEK